MPRSRTGAVDLHLHLFLTSAHDRDEWLTSRPSRFIPEKESTAQQEVWAGSRVFGLSNPWPSRYTRSGTTKLIASNIRA